MGALILTSQPKESAMTKAVRVEMTSDQLAEIRHQISWGKQVKQAQRKAERRHKLKMRRAGPFNPIRGF